MDQSLEVAAMVKEKVSDDAELVEEETEIIQMENDTADEIFNNLLSDEAATAKDQADIQQDFLEADPVQDFLDENDLESDENSHLSFEDPSDFLGDEGWAANIVPYGLSETLMPEQTTN